MFMVKIALFQSHALIFYLVTYFNSYLRPLLHSINLLASMISHEYNLEYAFLGNG